MTHQSAIRLSNGHDIKLKPVDKPKRRYVKKEKPPSTDPAPPPEVTKDLFGVLFNLEKIDKMIRFYENESRTAGVELTQKEPDYRTAEKMYLQEKTEYDAIKKNVDDANDMLDSLVKYRNRMKPDKEIKVMRKTSHTKKKPGGSRNPNIDWHKLTIECLTEVNRFLYPLDLWEIVMQKMPEYFATLSHRDIVKLKSNRIINWRFSSKSTKSRRGLALLGMSNDKIGLREWMDADGKPKIEYSVTKIQFDHEQI